MVYRQFILRYLKMSNLNTVACMKQPSKWLFLLEIKLECSLIDEYFSPLKTIAVIGSGFPSFFLGIPLADSTTTRNISEPGGGSKFTKRNKSYSTGRQKERLRTISEKRRQEERMKECSLLYQRRLSSAHDPPHLLPVKKKFTHSILSTGITPHPEDVRRFSEVVFFS